MENIKDYKISRHAQERFAERIMGKDTKCDANWFIVNNEDKIKTDINKMIAYGQLIYTGKSQKSGKGKLVDVYLKDLWIVLVDESANNVVTLYKVDLGLGDEFNKTYTAKMIDKLNEDKANLEDVKLQVQTETDMYKELIEESTAQINEYKAMIKNLEELCSGYQMVIDNNGVKVAQANRKVADTINTFVNKTEF